MAFICMPLSKRAIQLSPLTLTLATFSTPYHCWKRVRIKEGSLCVMSYTLGILSWGAFGRVAFPRGVQAPFFSAIPSLQFKFGSFLANFTSGQSLDEMIQAAARIAAFLTLLCIFHSSGEHTMNSSVMPSRPSGSLLSVPLHHQGPLPPSVLITPQES